MRSALAGLSVVTTPMKCVTKLSHRSSNTKGDGEGEGEEWDEEGAGNSGNSGGGGGANSSGSASAGKRKRDDIEQILESHSQQV